LDVAGMHGLEGPAKLLPQEEAESQANQDACALTGLNVPSVPGQAVARSAAAGACPGAGWRLRAAST
jgi:hypothetical protein